MALQATVELPSTSLNVLCGSQETKLVSASLHSEP